SSSMIWCPPIFWWTLHASEHCASEGAQKFALTIQQLRQMEQDGIVLRIVHHQVPPKVEYALTDWGQALCPALDALLTWAADRPTTNLIEE
ncbi:winged helix-turn-helix transcriptional regulator, partial [Ensifer sp. Root127]|uniref:winged helix-turn-helix transcriptional regulator n=1 Tax=Ensifer sp. Root127 TaxID=1736440 RepID=UPI001FCD6554